MKASPLPTLPADLYPPQPASVPKNLAKPTGRYRFHAWLALGGLAVFGGFYAGLTAWFSWAAYHHITSSPETNGEPTDIPRFVGAAVIAIFLLKGLFFRKSSGRGQEFEITAQTQPRLFAFLTQVAKEARAPRPHKVFLSPSVNAGVFYDLSLLNFLLPVRKNLEIGLGLVNVLTLSEFKAVLAHEFGHFAQRSMAVGRWVYTAQQVAIQLIHHRDALDSVLNFLSRIDIRIAWIGWVLRLIVWSIRSLLDTLLSLVMLAERALSREMEFQADLVAVSTSGSDALIHALYRLPAADRAWDEAKDFISDELSAGHATEDVFAVQTRILEHQRVILNEPQLGDIPPLPNQNRESHRIFTPELAEPPQMWSSHPGNHLREENAKRTYLEAELNSRSAWEIFDSAEGLRRQLSDHLLAGFEKPKRRLEDTLKSLASRYDLLCLHPRYRGAYLNRSIVARARHPRELFHQEELHGPLGAGDDLYPEELAEQLAKQRSLEKEKALLSAVRNRSFQPSDGKIRFRGTIIPRSKLKATLAEVDAELRACNEALDAHDRRCRSHHERLAASFSPAWAEYHRGLLHLLHYAEHNLRNLGDANRKLHNTYAVVTADKNVSGSELQRLLKDAAAVHAALSDIYRYRTTLKLDWHIASRMPSSWSEQLEEFGLAVPIRANISNWFEVYDSWLNQAGSALSALRSAALEELLTVEAALAEHKRNGTEPPPAVSPSIVPESYPTLLPGEERPLQSKLNWWDSFQTAAGPIASTFRFTVALAIVAGAVWFTFPKPWIEWIESEPWRDLLPQLMEFPR